MPVMYCSLTLFTFYTRNYYFCLKWNPNIFIRQVENKKVDRRRQLSIVFFIFKNWTQTTTNLFKVLIHDICFLEFQWTAPSCLSSNTSGLSLSRLHIGIGEAWIRRTKNSHQLKNELYRCSNSAVFKGMPQIQLIYSPGYFLISIYT